MSEIDNLIFESRTTQNYLQTEAKASKVASWMNIPILLWKHARLDALCWINILILNILFMF